MMPTMSGQALLVVLVLAAVPGCGGGGGATSTEARTASAILALDQNALAGGTTEADHASRLDTLLADVDGTAEGVANLSRYFQDDVVGTTLMARMTGTAQARTVLTAQETVDRLKGSEAYLMLDAFVSSVASNLLIPDPANMLLEFAKPEIFLATASVLIRAQIYDALVNGQLTPEAAETLYELGRQNPWKAKRALLAALSEPPPAWVAEVASPCLRYCEPTGDTQVYSGSFSKVFSASGGGCVWQESLAGTIEVVVTGKGTASDPFDGIMDVSGRLVETLTAGADCDAGGTYVITSFDGTVFGNDGKLYGEGDGVIGAGTFYAALGAAVISTNVTGPFEFRVGDQTVQMTVTLRQ